MINKAMPYLIVLVTFNLSQLWTLVNSRNIYYSIGKQLSTHFVYVVLDPILGKNFIVRRAERYNVI